LPGLLYRRSGRAWRREQVTDRSGGSGGGDRWWTGFGCGQAGVITGCGGICPDFGGLAVSA